MSVRIGNDIVQIASIKVQSDWNETNAGRPAYIRNKPQVATIGPDGKVIPEQLPELDYIPNTEKGVTVAELGQDGKVPPEQLPSLDYVPNDEKGAANGVATLDTNGLIPTSQIPEDAVQDRWWLLDGASGEVSPDYPVDLDEDVARWLFARLNEKIDVPLMGAANGVATLNEYGKVPSSQLPSLDYVPNSEKAAANGVATLGNDGKVPSSQLPSLDYIPNSEKGVSVATLGNDGKVPSSQLPALDYVPLTRTVNGKALSADITLGPSDIGSLATADTPVSLGVSMDPSTYVLTLQLKNSSNTVLDTKTVDLPLETMVVSASYSNGDLTLTLQSGQTLTVDISDIVYGLVNSDELGTPGGVAQLDSTGKVPAEQLPAMDYIPNDEKGAANGVATLDANSQLSAAGKIKILSAVPTSATAPDFIGQIGIFQTTIRVQYSYPAAWRLFMCTGGNANDGYNWIEICNSSYYETNYNLGSTVSDYVPSALKIGYATKTGLITKWTVESGVGGGALSVFAASKSVVDQRQTGPMPIVPSNLDYAVRSVLPNITVIPADTTSYALKDASATTNSHSCTYVHTPSAATTYVFPAVTTTNVVHAITLIIDFSTVQTYAFEDSEGNALLPLFTPSISQGDVYAFKCEYSVLQSKWLIYPVKEGAVSDDYILQAEKGVAGGVAGLDAEGKVVRTQLPIPGGSKIGDNGAVFANPAYGIQSGQYGNLMIVAPNNGQIDNRVSAYLPIVPSKLNYAVTAALTDANKIQLTDAQKASAQDTLGVGSAPLILTTAPTTSTVGAVGQLAVDTVTSKTYHCTAVNVDDTDPENVVTTYTWVDDINAKGGRLDDDSFIYVPGNDFYRRNGYNFLLQANKNGTNLIIGKTGGIRIGGNVPQLFPSSYSGGNILAGSGISVVGDYWYYFNNNLSVGNNLTFPHGSNNTSLFGSYNVPDNCYRIVGHGASDNCKNAEELSKSGNLFIAGGYQQNITVIDTATTEYTLIEGYQSHVPSAASTYTLPTLDTRIVADGRYFKRNTATDGTGYYGWLAAGGGGGTNRYTSSATPAVGDNTYTNTSLNQGAKAITAIDNRTHDIILLVSFANTQSIAFEDSQGNTIAPLDTLDIVQGDVVEYICSWDHIQSKWTISASHRKPKPAPPLPTADDFIFIAEGTDAQAATVGLTHSCKGWYDLITQSYRMINVGPCGDMAIYFGGDENDLMWSDPDDVKLNGSSLAEWEHTDLVRKEGGYPASPSDGTIVATTSVALNNKSAYKNTAFPDTGLDSNTTYYYRLFSYNSAGAYNVLPANDYPVTTTFTPQMVHQFSQAGTLLNYMNIGDGMVIKHPEFDNSSGYAGQLVQLVGYDCVETASGTGHAAVFQFVDLLYSATNNYSTMQFDAPENQYALTEDTTAVAGKTYYTLSGTTYTALAEGTDWTAGSSVPANAWYEKNPNPNYNNGTNKWDLSLLRLYLNSDQPANSWYTPQHIWDKGNYQSRNGFLYNFPFKDLLVPIRKKVARSTTYGGGYVECIDKIFLPSNYEVFGTAVNSVNEGERRWDWYNTHTANADRIKYLNGTASIWWLSSPHASNGNSEYYVSATGTSNNSNSNGAYGVSPAFAL